jgi:hypothetical protein
MTLPVTGVDPGTTSLPDAELYLLVAGGFSLSAAGGSALACTPATSAESDRIIDSAQVVLATASTTPTTSTTETAGPGATTGPSATTSPARPALVQTDQPQSGPGILPLLALGLGAVALGGGMAVALARRARRH